MFTHDRAIAHFTSAAATWSGGSLSLVAAAAVIFAESAVRGGAAQDVAAEMRAVVEDRGLGAKSAYRYVSIAQRLVAKLVEKDAETLAQALATTSPRVASDMIVDRLGAHGVASLDKLAGYLGGAYQKRSPSNALEKRWHAAPARVIASLIDAPPAELVSIQKKVARGVKDEDAVRETAGIWTDRLAEITHKSEVNRSRRHVQLDGVAHEKRRVEVH